MPLGKRIAPVLALLLLLPPVPAMAQKIHVPDYSLSAGSWPNYHIYTPQEVPEANLSDSPRLEKLIRGGVLYLSLADAIALAIENNLDIAYARYAPLQADTDILRARAGANLSGVQTQISTLSTAQSAATPGGGGGGGGGGFQQGQATGITVAASQQAAGGAAGEVTSFFGTQVTNLDPTFSGSMTLTRQSNPQISDFVTGTNTLIQDFDFYSFNYNQGFMTGTTVQLGFTTVAASNNNLRNNFNPTLTSDLSLNIRQPLTQGFGREINGRQIRIAKNRREQQDLAFKEQVIDTVKRIQDLYWDLVGLIAEVEARKNDLQLSENLLRDNTRSVELGLMAGVELLSAKAEASTNRNTLVRAETNVRLQEEVLKNAITKHGPTSDRLANVRIVPTDSVPIPNVERVEPLQDLITLALSSRPSLVQARMELHNSDLNLKGIRNAMLPRVDVTAFANNNALAGSVNQNFIGGPGTGEPSPFFLGGFGTALSQVFRRNFPDYGVRFDLNVPLKNRQAQADMTRETLSRRRQDIRLLQSENSVKLEVSRALTSLLQNRDAYQTAKEAREFREQMLEAEHKKFDLGSSTIFQIVQAQRDLGNARVSEIGAINSYVKAQVDLDRVVGRTLERNDVLIEEAFRGEMTKNPDPPPVMQSGPSLPREGENEQEALTTVDANAGNGHASEIALLGNLAGLCRVDDNQDHAEPRFERLLQSLEHTRGASSVELIGPLNVLAVIAFDRGDTGRAELLLRRALEILLANPSVEPQDAANIHANFGSVMAAVGDFAEAERSLQLAIALRRSAAQDDDCIIAALLDNLAEVYSDRQNFAESENLRREALAIWEQLGGRDNPGVAKLRNNRTGGEWRPYAETGPKN